MRYRSISTMSDLTQDYMSFLELIGASEYRKLLTDIGRGLNNKGYVTAFDNHRFFLELQLLNLDLEYIKSEQRLTTSLSQQLHEAVDFVCGVSQTITNLSYQARKTLRGQIIGGLKTNGLRPLQHEFRVAAQLSNQGYEVSFPDLEGLETFDLSADLKGQEFEIEAKSVSIFLGRPIDPDRAERFFGEVRKGFAGWSDGTEIPVIDVLLKSGLPATRQELVAIVEACISSARAMRDQYVNANCQVTYVGAVPDAPHERLAAAAREDWIKNGVIAFVPTTPPKVIIRLHSAKK